MRPPELANRLARCDHVAVLSLLILLPHRGFDHQTICCRCVAVRYLVSTASSDKRNPRISVRCPIKWCILRWKDKTTRCICVCLHSPPEQGSTEDPLTSREIINVHWAIRPDVTDNLSFLKGAQLRYTFCHSGIPLPFSSPSYPRLLASTSTLLWRTRKRGLAQRRALVKEIRSSTF